MSMSSEAEAQEEEESTITAPRQGAGADRVAAAAAGASCSGDVAVDSDCMIDADASRSEIGSNDVLLGRGLGTYNHVGNIRFRKLVNEHKLRYLACSKVDKPKIAKELVRYWRSLEPSGRFLARHGGDGRANTGTGTGAGAGAGTDSTPQTQVSEWYEVGDKKAQEKASQCLRERTPDVMPYYKYMRARKREQKVRSLAAEEETRTEIATASDDIHHGCTNGHGHGHGHSNSNSNRVQDVSIKATAPTSANLLLDQRQNHVSFSHQNRINSLQSQAQASATHITTLPPESTGPGPSSLDLLLQQRQIALKKRVQGYPLEMLVRVEQEREERALAAQILQNRSSFAMMNSVPATLPMSRLPAPITVLVAQAPMMPGAGLMDGPGTPYLFTPMVGSLPSMFNTSRRPTMWIPYEKKNFM